jgi:hypothetical protein
VHVGDVRELREVPEQLLKRGAELVLRLTGDRWIVELVFRRCTEGGDKGLEYRREVYAFKRFKPYADALRLIVVPNLTHYGHVESYNEGLANLMVTGFKEYFSG